MPSPESSIEAGRALVAAIDSLPPTAPTACAGWTAHEIVAHLAAGAKEVADLIEEHLDGRPERPTRGFEAREAPMRALSHERLRDRLVAENRRKLAAYATLTQRGGEETITFTGTQLTSADMDTHSYSEAVIHRWDLVGDDDTATKLLADPELTAHAVKVLNRMPVLKESSRSLGQRALHALGRPVTVVLRSPDQPDVVFAESAEGGHFEIVDRLVEGDAVITTDAANRLLVMWGRRSADRPLAVEGAPALSEALDQIFWPSAPRWPYS